jgi:hypothetical protein
MSNSDNETFLEYIVPIKQTKYEANITLISESEREAWFQQAIRIINDETIVEKYRDRCRNFFYFSRVSNLTLEQCISISPVVIPELVRRHPEFKWDWSALSANPNTTIALVLEIRNRPWNWHLLSKHPNISLKDVIEHVKLPWDWLQLSKRSNISWKDICDHPELPWSWPRVTKNPNIKIEHIFQNPNKEWDWSHISLHLVKHWEQVADHAEMPWDWVLLARNPNIEKRKLVDHLLENPEHIPSWADIREWFEGYLWDFLVVMAADSIFDKQMLYFFLDWPSICRDSSFTIPRINWCRRISILSWPNLSKNPNMTAEFVTTNIQKEWDWAALSKQTFLTPEFVDSHIEKWNFDSLMKNESLPKEYRETILAPHWLAWKSKQPVVEHIVINNNPRNLDIRGWRSDLCLEDIADLPNVVWEIGDILTQGFPIPLCLTDYW